MHGASYQIDLGDTLGLSYDDRGGASVDPTEAHTFSVETLTPEALSRTLQAAEKAYGPRTGWSGRIQAPKGVPELSVETGDGPTRVLPVR